MFKPHHRHYAAGFTIDCAVMIGLTALPFFVYNQLGGGADTSGTIGGFQAIVYGLLCLLLSSGLLRLAHFGLRVAAVGVAVYGLFFTSAVFMRNPVLFGLCTTIAMGSLALVWPALHAWIGAEPNLRRRNRRMSRFNLSWSLGFTVGPLLAGPLYAIDYHLPFLMVFLLSAVAVVILLMAPDERTYFGEPVEDALLEHQAHDRTSETHLLATWVANLVGNGLAQATRTVFPKRIEDLVNARELRLFFEDTPSPWIAQTSSTNYMWLAFTIALANALTVWFMGRSRAWHYRFSFLVLMQAIGAAAFWMLGTTTSLAVMLACFALIGIVWGAGFYAAVFYSVANPVLKHSRAAVNEGVVGLGGFTSSVALGFAVERFGHAIPYQCTPLFVAGFVALQYALLRYSAQRQRRLDEAQGIGSRI